MILRAGGLALAALALAACGDNSKAGSGATSSAPGGDPHAQKPPGGLGSRSAIAPPALASIAWTAPSGWKEGKPASGMRIAQFDVGEDSAGDAVQCIVFGGVGGSDEDNISRWLLAMGPGAKDSATITHSGDGSIKVTRVVANGAYTDSMRPGDPKTIAAATLFAAIVEFPSGKVHVKLVGERAVVDPASAQCDAFVASIKPR